MFVDPLAEQTMTPYQYVNNNPIMFTDPTGMSANPVYDPEGNHIGNTKEGFTGEILIYSGNKDKSFFENLSADDFLNSTDDDVVGSIFKLDDVLSELPENAVSNIWNDVVSKQNGSSFFGIKFDMANIEGGIQYNPDGNYNWSTSYYSRGKTGQIFGSGKHSYESTVENIQSSVIIHEYISHMQLKFGDGNKNHSNSYFMVRNSVKLWNSTTWKHKQFNWQNYNYYKNLELYNQSNIMESKPYNGFINFF